MIHLLTMQHFLNSLLLETSCVNIIAQRLTLTLNDGRKLDIPLNYVSPSGRHRYTGQVLLNDATLVQAISFEHAIPLLLDTCFSGISEQKKSQFLQRVLNSDDYIHRASDALIQRSQGEQLSGGFIALEQSLVGGHSMHPAPKCNEPLLQDEQEAYLPEFGRQFAIEWFAVKQERLVGEFVGGCLEEELMAFFKNATGKQMNVLPDDTWLPLPMHPLQAREWRLMQSAQQIAEGSVIDLKLRSGGWTATSSSRAIYHPDCRWMLKVSLPVRLTNSLRLMTEPEARRGIQFSKLMATPAAEELKQRFERAYFIEEPMWCSVLGDNEAVLDLPLVCFRDNLFYSGSDDEQALDAQRFYMLATLNQNPIPDSDGHLLTWFKDYAEHNGCSMSETACHWMQAFMDKVISPLCVARSDYGIVVLAHQQNLLIEIDEGMPIGVGIRDCQGFGLTSQAKQSFPQVLDHEAPEYYMEAAQLNPYHAYYVIGNSLLNTIAAIAASGAVDEVRLWALCRDHFDRLLKQSPKDDSFYRYILFSPTLGWKRNFFCFLFDYNEATLDDPTSIYCDIANPLCWPQAQTSENRIHKPLPGGRQLTLVDHEKNQSSLRFTIKELGQSLARFYAVMQNDTCCELHCEQVDFYDLWVWWSGLEHAFFSLSVQKVVVTNWPEGEKHISLSEFLELAPIWLHALQDNTPIRLTEAGNGAVHPVRPPHPSGIVFQRYYYHLKRVLTFRVIDVDRDLMAFHRWHNEPSVAKMWELEGALELHRNYLLKQKKDKHAYSVIGEFDGVSFGYFEVYWAAEDRIGPHYQYGQFDKGLHMLVGKMAYRGGTYFDTWGRAILQFCFQQEERMESIVGEPRADNHRVQKLNARVGMEKLFEFDFPHKRSALLLCGRERFFQQFVF